MDELRRIIGINRQEDVQWLCSLSEAELDMLISLKQLVIRRAEVVGHPELADKFDLKIIRAIGFVLMESFRGKLQTSSEPNNTEQPAALISSCNLLRCVVDNRLDRKELKACLGIGETEREAKKSSKRMRDDATD